MMHPKTEIWNIFHDGVIASVQGTVPGNVQLLIEIEYLRQFFSPAGKGFFVDLTNCTLLQMNVWEDSAITENMDRIGSLKTTLLSTESEDCPARIVTTEGELELNYESLSLRLDTGDTVTHEDICSACNRYWKDFNNRLTDPSKVRTDKFA